MESHVKGYIEKVKGLLDSLDTEEIEKASELIYQAYFNDKQIFIMGNGGSASTASHFTCDLAKGTVAKDKKRFRVISLNDNVAHFSALANDMGYEHVFVEQLKHVLNKEDLIVVISASGNSPNVVHAVKYAKDIGAKSIGIVGFSGGKVKDLADQIIYVKDHEYTHVEDVHSVLTHLISSYFKKKMMEEE